MVSLRELGKKCGLTAAAVSMALRDDPSIPVATRERVRRLANRHGYLPNRLVRGLRSKRTGAIAFILPGCRNLMFHELLHALQNCLEPRDYVLFVYNTEYDPDREYKAVMRALEHRVDGIVISPTWLTADAPAAQIMRTVRLPHVCLRSLPIDPDEDVIAFDGRQAGELVGEHLGGLGHRNVAFLGYQPIPSHEYTRLAGLRVALARYGGQARPEWSVPVPLTWPDQIAPSREAVVRLLAASPEITAIYCVNSYIAVGALEAAKQTGRRVPEDVSVASEVTWPGLEWLRPRLTVVHRDEYARAEAVAELIDRRINERISGKQTSGTIQTVMPVTLQIGESTGPAARSAE